jgi:hypothetical protein
LATTLTLLDGLPASEYKKEAMSIIEEVCSVKGHNIQSQCIGQMVEPQSKTIINKYGIFCTQCGKTLEECLKHRIGGTGNKRRARRKAQNDNGSNHASTDEKREDTNLEPVPSPPSGLSQL